MEFCGATNPDLTCDRRTALKAMMGVGGALAPSACRPRSKGGATMLQLAFCGQLFCVVPYEVARARGHFAVQGFSVELVYTRGGNAAIRRFASTGRLPLFALASAPGRRDAIRTVEDLSGTTVAISGLGNADHALLLFLLNRSGVNASQVRFATIGTNVFDALRIGQVDAAMVQEPALTLIVAAGGRELVNFMDIDEARMTCPPSTIQVL